MSGTLTDASARRTALTDTDHGLLVEAGAGSGKTAILAGRVALLLAAGVAPRRIAAITFTELAAAELATRVRDYVTELAGGSVPPPLEPAFATTAEPPSPTREQRANLLAALESLDELTSTTIHGFAGELTRPYPVEAGADPGATVMDAPAADALFSDVFDAWLRRRLGTSDGTPDPLVRLLMRPAAPGPDTLRKLAGLLRSHPDTRTRPVDLSVVAREFADLAERFCAWVDSEPAAPEAVRERRADVAAYAQRVAAGADAADSACACLETESGALFTAAGTVRVLKAKGAWLTAVRARGLSKSDADESFAALSVADDALAAGIANLRDAAADHLAGLLLSDMREVVSEYSAAKMRRAVMDFDDLIANAARLLRDREEVRSELAERYRYVLVDEFQDTDPLQAELVWRLTGEPNGPDWRTWPSRPGARFVVGDPNQSIYRFRGADPSTYATLKEGLARDPGSITVSLTTNFRSVPAVLANANLTFAAPLSADHQAGYTALASRRPGDARPALARLAVAPNGEVGATAHAVPDGSRDADRTEPDDTRSIREQRRAEAQAVADLCRRLVDGTSDLADEPVRPGEIALLAPGYTGLEEYERALEERGLNVASQAGKGLFRRQEVQDLVALAGALADPANTLALGALLRGPAVGVTDEELLDTAYALSEGAAGGGERPTGARASAGARLTLETAPDLIPVPRIAEVVRLLSPLSARRFTSTPYAVLSEAVEALELRAVLVNRHGGQAARALANLERFLQGAKAYALRGLRAFADDMWAAWSDGSTEREGYVDAVEDAITLITMHSAKGLEWRVVVPVGSMSAPGGARGPWYSRQAGRPVFDVLGHKGSSAERLAELEKAEQHAERLRLWYVTATRARDLLVVPEFGFATGAAAWCNLVAWQKEVEWAYVEAPEPAEPAAGEPAAWYAVEAQTPEEFAAQTAAVTANARLIERRAPSRQDDARPGGAGVIPTQPVFTGELGARILATLDEVEEAEPDSALNVGSVRGIVLHKLLEEIINGEFRDGSSAGTWPQTAADLVEATNADDPARVAGLTARASELLAVLGDVDGAVDAAEIARLALCAWDMPDVAALRGRLAAEVQVAGKDVDPSTGAEVVWNGVADAVAIDEDGRPEVVIDWKSDRSPTRETLAHYQEQLRAYLRLTGAKEGLLVLAARGEVLRVTAGRGERS